MEYVFPIEDRDIQAMLVSGSAQLLGITFLVGKKSLYKQLQISWSEMAKWEYVCLEIRHPPNL